MLTHCYHWEIGKVVPAVGELTQRLERLAHTEALLVLSKTSFPTDWSKAFYCPLVQGPSRFLRVYFNSPPAPRILHSHRERNAAWLCEFQELRRLSLSGVEYREAARQLREGILQQLDWEELELFPVVAGFLQCDRPTRELRYEHEGIRKFLPRLEESLSPQAENRAWERFSLDLIHLLEHHIEHEESGLYPVFERLV